MLMYGVDFYEGLDGKSVERNPLKNPYQYDFYVIWKHNYKAKKSKNVYSDRLYEWDTERYEHCCQEIFGYIIHSFNDIEPKKINLFLNKYFGKSVKLTEILKGCNWSTGYPIWEFIYSLYFRNSVCC